MKNVLLPVALVFAFAHGLNAAVTPVIDGNTYTFTVESGTETYTTTISGAVKVVKEGAGILDLGSGANTFTGGIEVNGGTLQGSYSALGGLFTDTPPHNLVKVESGASLVITDTTGAGKIYALATNLEVAGPGVGNNGAVQRAGGSASLHGLFKNVTLKGDTTFCAASRWGLAEGGTFDMGGHKLTIIGGDTFEFYSGSITVQNAGEIERTAGSLLIQSNITGSKDKITLDNGTMLTMWGQTLSWPVDIRASTTVRAGSGDARRYNVISGNMTVGTRVTWNPDAAGRCMTLASGIDCAGDFLKTGPGTLYVTGKVDRVVGAFTFTNGTVVLENAGKFLVTNRTVGGTGFIPNTAPANISGVWSSVPRMTVTGETLFTMPKSADGTTQTTEKHHLMIGSANDRFGILDIQSGAVVSNDLNVGRNSRSVGAVYLNGGKLFWRGGTANQEWLGHGGNGYMVINNGSELVSDGFITMGKTGNADGTGGIGIVHQRGGSVRMTAGDSYSLRLAREDNSYAHWYQTGGTFTGAHHALFCFADGLWYERNVEAVLTLSGADTTMTLADDRYIKAYVSSNAVTSVVNLNDGATLTVRKIFKESGKGTHNDLFADPDFLSAMANSKLYLNFDGGILKPREYGTFFNYGSTASNANDDPNRITVYSGGAIIDTSLCTSGDTSWNVPLQKPSGNVLLSVSLPTDSAWVNKYIAPPRVVISGVNTHGATAVAEFDETAQRITGITITSPGNDVPNDITVTINGGSNTKTTYSCPFTVGAPATDGGLTKRGACPLDFNMSAANPNTYEGPTVVEEGTLKFSNRTYPEASPLVLKGGTISLVGHAYTLKSIEGYGAITGSGGVTVTNELRVSCADIFGANRSIAAQKVTLADGVRLVVTDPENLDSYKSAGQVAFLTASTSLSGNAPATALSAEYGAWSCVKVGNSLKFGVPRGTMILFK